MASLFRTGITRLVAVTGNKGILGPAKYESARWISGKTARVKEMTRPPPYNYEDKSYTMLHYFVDKTTARFDENTKVIVVEGPPASGKTKLAKELAEELDMQYFPEANLDMYFINESGYDLRQLDSQVPDSCRSFDINDFLLNPKHRLTASFQMKQLQVKYSQYIDALAHVLSTGQGVILDRCCYSDFAFVEAMYSQGYLSKGARSVYYELRRNTLGELMRPHLVLYLDVPVPKVLENIKKRNFGYEVNSPAMNPKYLEKLEYVYKQQYLKEISKHAELLVYDWSHGGDPEIVVEDMERIDFNRFDEQDTQLKDWVYYKEEEWAFQRRKYSDDKEFLISLANNVARFDVPELLTSAEDMLAYREVLEEAPGERWAPGYDKSMGDEGLLFKMAFKRRSTLPLRERRDHSKTA